MSNGAAIAGRNADRDREIVGLDPKAQAGNGGTMPALVPLPGSHPLHRYSTSRTFVGLRRPVLDVLMRHEDGSAITNRFAHSQRK
jgi:hypothetical protein